MGVVKETFPDEARVALVPNAVKKLIDAGLCVIVQNEAGRAAGFLDAHYIDAGAKMVDDRASVMRDADVIVVVRAGGANPDELNHDIQHLTSQHTLIGLLEPLYCPDEIAQLAHSGATLLSMELMPRITRAQSMDVLSSMTNAAGYQAVLLAAARLNKFFPMLMTAAGTITPSKVFILGVGVMGLQAIATAKRLGAVVQAYDVRDVVKEQVESLGAQFVELDIATQDAEAKGGYAKAQSDAFYQKQRELLTQYIAKSDVVITTALVPGRTAPILLTKEMVASMQSGSIVIDCAAEKGGNCELTQLDQEVLTDNGVLVLGPGNLSSQVAYHTSQLYSNNLVHFIEHLLNDEGHLTLDLEDEITAGTLVAQRGKLVHPQLIKKDAP